MVIVWTQIILLCKNSVSYLRLAIIRTEGKRHNLICKNIKLFIVAVKSRHMFAFEFIFAIYTLLPTY